MTVLLELLLYSPCIDLQDVVWQYSVSLTGQNQNSFMLKMEANTVISKFGSKINCYYFSIVTISFGVYLVLRLF